MSGSRDRARRGYFLPDEVTVEDATKSSCRQDKDEPAADGQFCPACGSTTRFTLTPGAATRVGNVMAGIELRYPDDRAWSGAGEFACLHPAVVFGE